MEEETKQPVTPPETEESAPEPSVAPEPEAVPQPVEEPARKEEELNNSLRNKRGRMIAAGLVATVILSVIALVVAGVFQLTSRWLIVCPVDVPVNDPAPVLWKAMVEENVVPAALGTPTNVRGETGLKVRADSPEGEKSEKGPDGGK